MLYTAAPSTCPTGSNPVLLIAVNSSAVSADPQVPVPRISASRAFAAGGRSFPGLSTVNQRPLVALAAGLTLQDKAVAPAYPSPGPSPGHLSCASHSSLRRCTVSRQCSAASRVG